MSSNAPYPSPWPLSIRSPALTAGEYFELVELHEAELEHGGKPWAELAVEFPSEISYLASSKSSAAAFSQLPDDFCVGGDPTRQVGMEMLVTPRDAAII